MQRRGLLKLGVGSAAVLALAGGGLATWAPGLVRGQLSAPAREVFEATARVVLGPCLPADGPTRRQALEGHLQRLDVTLAGLPEPTQAELSQLLGVLSTFAGRVAMTGLWRGWREASLPDLVAAFDAMRVSSLSLRQQAYQALRDLTNAAYFSDASAWPNLGYPGPMAL